MNDAKKDQANITREQLIDLLNEDLAREYQAIIAYIQIDLADALGIDVPR